MPAAAAADASGDESQRREPEVRINRFVRSVAFVEWAGNAFGVLAFTWATVVLLGGFCSSLNSRDFWLATVMIFIEAFRIFSRSYIMDNHSLFGTTRALRWISSSFSRMLGQPQEGNEVVLIMSLWINLFDELMTIRKKSAAQFYADTVFGILKVVLLVLMSKLHLRGAPQLKSGPRRHRRLQLWAVLVALLSIAAYNLSTEKGMFDVIFIKRRNGARLGFLMAHPLLPAAIADIVTMVVAVLLLNLRPRCVANRVSSPFAGKLVSLAKVISALWSALYLVKYATADRILIRVPFKIFSYLISLGIPFTRVVLSLGSLHKQSPETSPADRWIDVVMHVLFLLTLVIPIPDALFFYWADPSANSTAAISSIILLAALLVGNLQIPVAVIQVVLSSWRLHELLPHNNDYSSLPKSSRENLVPAIAVFYVLALSQGALYIMASIIGPFSFFPRRSLARRLNLSGQRGAKAIDLYYQDAYATRMRVGVLSSRNRISLAGFAMDSLLSGSGEMELAGVIVLDSLLQESQPREELIPRITSSYKEVSTLIAMLGWTAKRDRDVRLFAARVTAKLAGSVRIGRFPGILNMVSSLLDADENQPAAQDDPLLGGADEGPNGGCSSWSWVRRCRQRIKESWSLPKDPHSTHRNSLPVLGMVILEKLARDHDNCAEIFKDTNLISKAIGLMGYSTNDGSREEEQQNAVICSSLNFVRQLAITGEKIGVAIRQELWNHPFLVNNLAGVLEDARSSPQVWEPAMDIIAKLALVKKAAGCQIGRIQVITERSMHAFLGRDELTNMQYGQSLQKVAGEALANLSLWGTANCSAILEQPGYEVIKDLKGMLSDNEYRYVAASLLLNLCAHCGDKLSAPDSGEHLQCALSIVMEYIMAAEAKQLESLIGLASEIGSIVREAFVHKLESQTNNGAGLVQKLVDTLNSANKKPNPEHPRMRRFVVKIMISILESCHRTVEKIMEEGVMEGLMEALTKIERSPSKVEKYRVFYGNIGVVLESGEPMSALVARAKALIRRATQAAGAR